MKCWSWASLTKYSNNKFDSGYREKPKYYKERIESPKNKQFFIHEAAKRTGFSVADLAEVYNVFNAILLEVIDDAVKTGTEYAFGPFIITTRIRAKYQAYNSMTNTFIDCPEDILPHVRLKEGVKSKYRHKNQKKASLEKELGNL